MEEKEETLRQKLRYDMRLRISRTDHAFGPGVAELMEHVEATGSLSKGCKCMQDLLLPAPRSDLSFSSSLSSFFRFSSRRFLPSSAVCLVILVQE